jgi:hypothetical protein
MKYLFVIILACAWAFGQDSGVVYATQLGIDCSGVMDNSPVWRNIVSSGTDNTTYLLPQDCKDNHGSTVTVSSRAGFTLKSSYRCQNGGGSNCPEELWTGTTGGMWDFQANQAPTVEGLLFTNTTNSHLDYFLQFDGNPVNRIGTEAMIRYNSFINNRSDANFDAILINIVSGQNHEKNVITDNDFFCSQSAAHRETDSGQIVLGSNILTCGSNDCSFMSISIGTPILVSYATGALDTIVQARIDDNHLQMSASATTTQINARVHSNRAYGRGITIGSVNSKHNTIERDSFTQCDRGLNVINGSFSASHLGGSFNDVLAYINDISESSELSYLEDENSLREVYLGHSIDSPVILSHMRNSIYNHAESDGFIYFDGSVRVVVRDSLIQNTPPANAVLFRAANPRTVLLNSFGNSWSPGQMTMDNLGFSQWRGATVALPGTSIPSGVGLVICGDFGINDMPIMCEVIP